MARARGLSADMLEPIDEPVDLEPELLDPIDLIESNEPAEVVVGDVSPGTIDLRGADEPAKLRKPKAIILSGGLWPSNVPNAADAAFALTGTIVPPSLHQMTSSMRQALTHSERQALAGHDRDLYLAVTLRWRLAVAFELAPKNAKTEDVDRHALDVLLADLEKALHALSTIHNDGSERFQVAALARSALLRSAAFLSQLAPRKAEVHGERAPLPRKTSNEPRPSGRAHAVNEHVTTETRDLLKRIRRRTIVFAVVFAVVASGTFAFHFIRWRASQTAGARIPVSKISAGTLLRANRPDGVLVLHAVEGQKPMPADAVKAFKVAAESEGKMVIEAGRNTYIAVPKEVSRAPMPKAKR